MFCPPVFGSSDRNSRLTVYAVMAFTNNPQRLNIG
jgi:hypothetical protein